MDFQAVISMPSISLLPEDEHQISFSVRTVNAGAIPDTNDYEQWSTALSQFLKGSVVGQANELELYLSGGLEMNAEIRWYLVTDLTGASDLGSPVHVHGFAVTQSETGLPSEIAVYITEHAVGRATAPVEVGATRPRARHTGQVRFGPLSSTGTTDIDPNGVVRVATQFMTDLTLGYEHANNLLQATPTPARFAVWSREDAIFRSVNKVVVNNAFDIQNSRGYERSAQVERVIPLVP